MPVGLHIAFFHRALADDSALHIAALLLPSSLVVLHLTSLPRALWYFPQRLRPLLKYIQVDCLRVCGRYFAVFALLATHSVLSFADGCCVCICDRSLLSIHLSCVLAFAQSARIRAALDRCGRVCDGVFGVRRRSLRLKYARCLIYFLFVWLVCLSKETTLIHLTEKQSIDDRRVVNLRQGIIVYAESIWVGFDRQMIRICHFVSILLGRCWR